MTHAMHDGLRGIKRPHSPEAPEKPETVAPCAAPTAPETTDLGSHTPMEKGQQVLFFYESNASDPEAALVCCGTPKSRGPGGFHFVGSHMWLHGTLAQACDLSKVDQERQETWPKVMPKAEYSFMTRKGTPKPQMATPLSVRWVCPAKSAPCKLSLMFVRWGGEYSKWMDEQEANDGDWGKYGSPPSDEYMGHVVNEGIKVHPGLRDEHGMPLFELHHVFLSNSKDAFLISQQAHIIRAGLKAQRRAAFWMLWPAEWEDFGDPDYACYIERHSMFAAMRACEALGIRSLFPHPADQYELITSKSWMATLSLHPGAFLPAATLVSKGSVKMDAAAAAESALRTMHHIRRMNPYPVDPEDPPAPSAINQNGIQKGVVKLGWSWENRFVVTFNSPSHLQARLKEMMNQPGCLATYCIVQEWVDFDFEMRLYFLPPPEWPAKHPIEPEMIQCNAWGKSDDTKSVGVSRASFSKLSEEKVLSRWEGDVAAWQMAKAKAIEISQFLLAWLLSAEHQPVPSMRLDFMVKRLRPGKARVVFGEYCEQGACVLGWQGGPPTIWRACLDAALRDK